MMYKSKTCKSCTFFHINECRKHAPVLVTCGEGNNAVTDGLFVDINKNGWCGDWEGINATEKKLSELERRIVEIETRIFDDYAKKVNEKKLLDK